MPDPFAQALAHLARQEGAAAELAFRAALTAGADRAQCLQGLGKALYDQHRFDEAEAAFGEAEGCDPVPALGRYHRGLCRLVRGDFAAGWPLWEARLEVPAFGHLRVPIPRWRGEPLRGRRLLVLAEQGYGDVIQFARFLPALVRATGAHVTFGCGDPLQRLLAPFARCGGFAMAAGRIHPGDHHAHTYICSLARTIEGRPADLPGPVPYLEPDPSLTLSWLARLPEARLRVGLCWAGRPGHPQDAARSLDPALLTALAALPDVALIGLTRGAAPPAAGLLRADWGPEIGDFADSAAMIAALDLVITVDTAIAHLAGALGRPAWVLLPYAPDWRWQLARDDSPWYPSLRLFRQARPGDWPAVVSQVAAALRDRRPLRY